MAQAPHKTREQLLAELESQRRSRASFFGAASAFRYLPGELLKVIKSPLKSFEKGVAKPVVTAVQKVAKSKFGKDVITAIKKPLQEGSETRKFLDTKTGKGLLKGAELLDIATSRVPAGIIKQKGNVVEGVKQGIRDPKTNLFNLVKEKGQKSGLPFTGILLGIGAEIAAPGPEAIRPVGKLSTTAAKGLSVAQEIAKARGSISKFIPTGEAIPASRGARIAREGSNKATTFIDTNPFTREVRFNPTRFDQVVEDVMAGKRIEIGGKGGVIFAKGGTEGRASVSRRLLNTVLDFEEGHIRNVSLGQSGKKPAPAMKLDGLENTTDEVRQIAGRAPEQPLSIRTLARGAQEQPFPSGRVEAKIADVSPVFRTSDSIAEVRSGLRGPVSDVQAQKVARQLGINADDVLRLPDKPVTKEVRYAVGGVIQDQIDRLRVIEGRMYKFATDSPEGSALRQQFAIEKIKTLKLVAKERALSSEAGRALQAEKGVYESISTQERRIVKFLNDPKVPQDTKDFVLDKVREFAGDPKQMDDLLKKMNNSSITEMIVEFSTAAKLWAIPTHIVNTITSFARLLTQLPVRALSAGFDKTIGAVYGGKPERFIADVQNEALGQWAGWKTSGHHAINALLDEDYTLKLRSVEDFYGGRGPAIKGRLGKDTYYDSFLDWIGPKVRIPFRALGIEDAILRAPAQSGYLFTVAGREASRKGYKFGTEKYNQFVSEFVLNPTAEAIEAVAKEGDTVLFQRELPEGLEKLNRLRSELPATKLVVPFFRTLADLIKQFIEFTPAAPVLLPSTRAALKTRGPAMDVIAKMTLGTTVLVPMTMWIMEDDDRVVLAAPKNEAEKDAFYAKYGAPYSIRFGDTYYPFNRFSPFAEFIVASKVIADAIKNEDEQSMQEVITDAFFTMSTNLLDKTFAIGIRDALDALTDPESGRAKRFIHGLLTGSLIPTIVSRAATSIDPTIYETNTLGEAFLSKIPFATKKLNPRVDVFGKDLIRPSTGMVRFLSPVVPSKVELDVVREELEAVGYKLGFPGREAFSGQLTDDQYRELKIISGRTIYKVLFEVVTDPEYQELSDAQKEKTIARIVDRTREISRIKVAKELMVINEIKKRLIKKFGYSAEDAEKKAAEVWATTQKDKAGIKSEEKLQQFHSELDTPPPPTRTAPVPQSTDSLGSRLLKTE